MNHLFLPIGSMGLVYFFSIWHTFMVNVGKYTSPMDPSWVIRLSFIMLHKRKPIIFENGRLATRFARFLRWLHTDWDTQSGQLYGQIWPWEIGVQQ